MQIASRLQHFFSESLLLNSTDVTAAQWRSLPLEPEWRFGWMPPVNLQDLVDDRQLIVMISSELLAEVVATVDEKTGASYLDVVEMIVALHVALRKKPAEERVREVNMLADTGGLRIRSLVEFAALDAGVVPLGH